MRYLVAIPCGRAGPEANAVLKSTVQRQIASLDTRDVNPVVSLGVHFAKRIKK